MDQIAKTTAPTMASAASIAACRQGRDEAARVTGAISSTTNGLAVPPVMKSSAASCTMSKASCSAASVLEANRPRRPTKLAARLTEALRAMSRAHSR